MCLRYLLAAIILATSCNLYGRSIKELKSIAYELMPSDSIINFSGSNPSEFWRLLMRTNKPFQKALNQAKAGKAKEVQRWMGDMVSESESNPYGFITDSITKRRTTEFMDAAGVKSIFREHELHLIASPVANALTTPNGKVYLTTGLIEQLGSDTELIIAVYAHELAHYVLQHHFTHMLAYHNKKKQQALIADITTGLSAIAQTSAAYYAASNGVTVDWDKKAQMINRINASTHKRAERSADNFQMTYGRNQEFEADIIATYFLKAIGIESNKLALALKLIESDFEVLRNDESTHPLTTDRITMITNIEQWHRSMSEHRIERLKYDSTDDIYQ